MADLTIDGMLGEYSPSDYSVRLVETILKAIPNAPAYVHYRSIDDAVRALNPEATAAQYAEARALANERDVKDLLWMGGLLDTGDQGYAVYTGIRSALNFFFGDKSKGLENDDEQRNDAILKAVGIAYMVWHAYPGTLAEKTAAFRNSPAGQTIAIYYGAAEVALPFADNALVSGGNFVSTMFAKAGNVQVDRLIGMAGGKSMDNAKAMLNSIMQPLEQVSATASKYVGPIAATAKQYVPGVVGGADKVAGVVAAGADVLPIYRLLASRLAAESVARRALKI
jgi:hypothetical protein